MKKNIITALAALAFMASCSSDKDYQPAAESTITVTSAQTSLGPNESEGSITVDCTPVEVYAKDPSWLTTSVEGNVVKFTAIANDSRESRNTQVVIKKAANDSINVNVSQYGLVLTADNSDIIMSNDKAAEFVKSCSCNTDIKIIYAPDWVNASVSESNTEMNISVSENNTGHMRADYIKYQAAAVKDSFIVKQYDFDKDIAGRYVFAYYDFNEDEKLELQTVHATLNRNYLDVEDWGYKFEVSINDSIGAVELRSSQYLGTFGKYYIYNSFLSEEGYIYYGSTSGVISAPFKYSEKYGTYGFFSGIAYSIQGESANFLAMLIQAFKAKNASNANYVATLMWVVQPYFLKMTEEMEQNASARKNAPTGTDIPAAVKRLAPKPLSISPVVYKMYPKTTLK